MSKKNLKLLIVLLILIGLAYLYQGPYKNWEKKSDLPDNFLSDIQVEEIDKIEVINAGDSQTLIKEEDSSASSGQAKWKVETEGDFYVNDSLNSTINQVLKDAVESNFELVSSNSGKKSEFKTDASGINVKIYRNGDELASFIVGTLGPDFVSTYVSQNNINETYLVNANLFGAFSVYDFRDKTIFKSNKDNINKIRFQYPDREFIIEKKDDKWMDGNQELDSAKVDEVLAIMTNLNAAALPEQKFEGTGLEKNLIIVEATGDFVNNTIMIGDSNEAGQYFAKRGDSDNIYLITEDQRNKLDKNIGDLK